MGMHSTANLLKQIVDRLGKGVHVDVQGRDEAFARHSLLRFSTRSLAADTHQGADASKTVAVTRLTVTDRVHDSIAQSSHVVSNRIIEILRERERATGLSSSNSILGLSSRVRWHWTD
ncbi:hypothetical protein CISG_03751 [Coccidioides immitis RMSCC 3703]|uniref:Uncharacterized protein n=2 Tax=Coccidioides immitis TaxID=5501 RepID=A0A0J8QMM2_COCIT|nr:hypothetical protein CIRG_10386 [Coccidioides immitis RMSCC 2394]KMU73701.1 hypothetical protein CISG_03751 [Coccidioides immitis RMSCC 3703]